MKLWNRRSLLEQVLLVLSALAAVVIVALSITVGVRNKNGWGCPDLPDAAAAAAISDDSKVPAQSNATDTVNYCTTDECVVSAAQLISSRDGSLDPCDDFYEYACRGWIRGSVLFGDGRLGMRELTQQRINLRIKALLEDDATDEQIPEHFDKARSFYSTCTNWLNRESDGVSGLLSDVTDLGGYPALLGDQWNSTGYNYVTALGRMWERGFDIRFLVNVELKPDPRNTSKLIIVLGQLERSTFASSQLGQNQVSDLYAEYGALFLDYLCQQQVTLSNCSARDKGNVTFEVKQAIQVERNIAASVGPISTAKYTSSRNVMKLGDLQSLVKEIDWTSLIRFHLPSSRVLTGGDEVLLAISLESFRNLSRYLADLDSSEQGRLSLANYLAWRLVRQAAPDLNQRMLITLFDLSAHLDGQMRLPDLWTLCLQETVRAFRFSVAAAYLEAFYPDFATKQRPAIQKVVQKLRTSLKKMINETDWMDDITKREAHYKLDRLYFTVGYPEGLLSESRVNTYYKKVKVGDVHYENVRNVNVFLQSKAFGRYGRTADRSEWDTFPVDLLSPESTSYLPANNSAYISIGMMQDLHFDVKNPPYVNYGRLGPIIGGLLGQALDYEGSLYDSNGNQRKWWREETYSKFETGSQCMVSLFDNYFVPEANMSLNGQKLLLQNTAQELGILDSYKVFVQELANGLPSSRLPGIDLNEKQLFWLAYAASVCEKESASFLAQQVASGVETPSRYSVNGLLSNNKNFIRDFQCLLGSKMNLDDLKCGVWGP